MSSNPAVNVGNVVACCPFRPRPYWVGFMAGTVTTLLTLRLLRTSWARRFWNTPTRNTNTGKEPESEDDE